MRYFAVVGLLALILPLTACTVVEADHGYRDYSRHDGRYPPSPGGGWRWDDDLRVYVNPGYPRVYYHDNAYYRWHDNRWSVGNRYGGPWRAVDPRYVPPRLGQRYYAPPPRNELRRYEERRYDGYHEQRQREYQRREQLERREAEQRRRYEQQRERERQRQWQEHRRQQQLQQHRQPPRVEERHPYRQHEVIQSNPQRQMEERRQRQNRQQHYERRGEMHR